MRAEPSLLQIEETGCTQETETSNGSQSAPVEALRQEVAQGFLDAHARANKNAGKALEIASFCYALIELLQEKGLITFAELDGRKAVVGALQQA